MMKERNLGGGMDDLQKMILAKNKSRASFLDDLAAKYGGADGGGSAKKKAGIKPRF